MKVDCGTYAMPEMLLEEAKPLRVERHRDPYPWQVADYGTITINPFGTRGCPISRNEHTD